MKWTKNSWLRWAIGAVVMFLLCSPCLVRAQITAFTFTLDEPCKTSAGVFKPDGTLVRTLWSKVRYYSAGTYSGSWDGLDDNSNLVPAGQYQIKVLQHNTEYVWDGAIGNSSTASIGPTMQQGFHFIQDMTITGTNVFCVSGYDEGKYPFRHFSTTNPQQVLDQWYWAYPQAGTLASVAVNIYDRNWIWTTTDGSWVYFACSATFNPSNLVNNSYPGCIVACHVVDHSVAYFTNGIGITNGPGFAGNPMPNGIYVGTQPGLSGLAVQQNGNLLAAAVAPDNTVYLMDKRSGAVLSSFPVNRPGRMNFSYDNSLWVVSGSTVVCYTNCAVKAAVALTISGLSEPLDVAISPLTSSNLVLIADGGASQQLKAFNNQGKSLWTYGLLGGYQMNGIAVTTNKFWFSYNGVDQTFLCFAPDGSFWVGDEENHRTLHFSSTCAYLEQIMYQPFSYRSTVDKNNPSRVFNQFLEFSVDYTKPVGQGWQLMNNWKGNVDTNHIGYAQGPTEVTTFPNGRTYALIDNNRFYNTTLNHLKELCELTTNGLRFTGIFPMTNAANRWNSFGTDGFARASTSGNALWYLATLKGYDTNNNPVWNPETLIASASQNAQDPIPRYGGFGDDCAAISSSNIVISLDNSLNNGWHLGGIKAGTTNWLWKVSRSMDLNGCGNYEIANGLTYAGDVVQALDRNVVYGFHGEFFRSQGEASQHMHYYDDGLFVGQFGESSLWHNAYENPLPAFAGNAYSPSFLRATNGDYYLWHNDENAHGPQRWHIVNAKNIREQAGTVSLGATLTLTNPPAHFPVGVLCYPANGSATITWQPVSGASSYRVYYSLMNGGPFSFLAGNTTNTSFIASGLTNGQTYYFAVSAMVNGQESITSEQSPVFPFDTSAYVVCSGSQADGIQMNLVLDLQSNAPSGQPAYLGAEYSTGVLNPRERNYYGFGQMANETLGTKSCIIYDWSGAGLNFSQIQPSYSILTGIGWKHISSLKSYYKINGAMCAAYGGPSGTVSGLTASPVGTIAIGVTDTNFHYLTVGSPSCFNAARNFKLGITAVDGSSASYSINENPGYSHMFQFIFRGNITLWADATAGANLGYGGGGIIQALFLDDVPIAPSAKLTPPSNVHVSP